MIVTDDVDDDIWIKEAKASGIRLSLVYFLQKMAKEVKNYHRLAILDFLLSKLWCISFWFIGIHISKANCPAGHMRYYNDVLLHAVLGINVMWLLQ